MKPYYDDGKGIIIYHGDCREVLPQLPKVDCLVTDPPWKATKNPFVLRKPGDGRGVAPSKRCTGLTYGQIGEFDPLAISQAIALCESDTLIMCGYLELAEVIGLTRKLRAVFGWHNPTPAPIPGPVAARDLSFIVWGGLSSSVDPAVARWRSSLFSVGSLKAGCFATERLLNEDGSTAHPAQEPLELMGKLITPICGTILDPFMGSGTTLRAAKDLSRHAIGIEIEEHYCEIAVRRLSQEVLQFA